MSPLPLITGSTKIYCILSQVVGEPGVVVPAEPGVVVPAEPGVVVPAEPGVVVPAVVVHLVAVLGEREKTGFSSR
jgi:hypothetical protein